MFTHNTPTNGWTLIGGSVTTIGKIATTLVNSRLYRITPMRLQNHKWSTDTFDIEEWHRPLNAPDRVDQYEPDEHDVEYAYQTIHIPDACMLVADAFGGKTHSYDVERISHEVDLFFSDDAYIHS